MLLESFFKWTIFLFYSYIKFHHLSPHPQRFCFIHINHLEKDELFIFVVYTEDIFITPEANAEGPFILFSHIFQILFFQFTEHFQWIKKEIFKVIIFQFFRLFIIIIFFLFNSKKFLLIWKVFRRVLAKISCAKVFDEFVLVKNKQTSLQHPFKYWNVSTTDTHTCIRYLIAFL